MSAAEIEGRWDHLDYLLRRESEFAAPGFEVDTVEEPSTKHFLTEDARILVIGAGGLGCEILKDLALSGFKNIDVIDMDTIDVSNLNRQFLFRKKDVGRPKAEVAAEFINTRVPGAKVQAHYKAIQDMPLEFYQDFNLIIAGLDSVKARRWINSTLVSLVERDDEGNWDADTIIPLIDGGTEAFKGQARVILPRITSCFECSLELFPADPLNFQMCTLANTPRQPEHCIEYITLMIWPDERKGEKLDKDNPDHMMWIFNKALERANTFGIKGVTLKLTQGVVKRIIPAIAATNAIISAACVNEVFKIATRSANYLDNYMMYNGTESVYTNTFAFEKKAQCPVCGSESITWSISGDKTLQQLIEELLAETRFQLSAPSISVGTESKKRNLYLRNPRVLEEQLRPNLDKALKDLIQSGDVLFITDPNLPSAAIELNVKFTA